MAYEKTNWVDNETPINAANLNKMEEGIVEASKTGGVLDGTIVEWEEEEIPEGYEEVEGDNVYSTTEQVVGIWFGKPLYSKGFTGTTATNTSPKTLSSGLKVKNIVNYKGYVYDTNGDLSQVIGKSAYVMGNLNTTGSKVYSSYGEIFMEVGSYLTNKNFELTVEYTKTTD